MKPRVALALAGPLLSGKSTVAQILAKRWEAPVVSFGGYVRAQARLKGFDMRRSTLQDLGQQLLEEQGPESFCRSVLADRGLSPTELPVILDGVRHPSVLQGLRVVYAPRAVVLAFLDSPEDARAQRVSDQAEAEGTSAAEWAAHETESHLSDLRVIADVVADDPTPESAADSIRRSVEPAPNGKLPIASGPVA
jgi:hypothetical protein